MKIYDRFRKSFVSQKMNILLLEPIRFDSGIFESFFRVENFVGHKSESTSGGWGLSDHFHADTSAVSKKFSDINKK